MKYSFDAQARSLRAEVPIVFLPYVDAAFLRLQVVFPHLSFTRSEDVILVSEIDAAEQIKLRGELSHQIYRERIFSETLAMRKSLLSAVMG